MASTDPAAEDVDLDSLTTRLLQSTETTAAGREHLKALIIQTAKFCFSHSFNREQIESFCRILHIVMRDDSAQWQRTAKDSFAQLQSLLLELSVDRPPRGIPLYSPLQATLAIDFALKTYYAQFKLYKRILSPIPEPAPLSQGDVAELEVARPAQPLSDAMLIQSLSISTNSSSSSSSSNGASHTDMTTSSGAGATASAH